MDQWIGGVIGGRVLIGLYYLYQIAKKKIIKISTP